MRQKRKKHRDYCTDNTWTLIILTIQTSGHKGKDLRSIRNSTDSVAASVVEAPCVTTEHVYHGRGGEGRKPVNHRRSFAGKHEDTEDTPLCQSTLQLEPAKRKKL